MNTKDAQILAQVAAKAAATIHSGTGDTTGYVATVELIQDDLIARCLKGADPLDQAEANVLAAFPGATVVPAPVAAPAVGTFAPVAPVAAQAPVAPGTGALPFPSTGNDKEDNMLANLIANPDDWWNNISDGGTSYTGGAKPDFRHKTLVDAKNDKYAIWLVSRRYGRIAPDAVFAALGLANPGAVAPVPAATAAIPQAPRPDEAPF